MVDSRRWQVLKESKFKEHGRITPGELSIMQRWWATRSQLPPFLRGVRCRRRLPGIQVPRLVLVSAPALVRPSHSLSLALREKGDASKARDYLPADKQYLVTRGVPCLRRATALAYTDADEDAERLLSFGDLSATGNEADEWVETHAGRAATADSAANAGNIDEIPDVDESSADDVADQIGRMGLQGVGSVGEIPDMDEIPDMEEDLEAEDEATAAPKVAAPSGVIEAR